MMGKKLFSPTPKAQISFNSLKSVGWGWTGDDLSWGTSPVGGEVLQESKEISHHHEHGPGPALHQLPHLHHEFVLRLQL